MSPSARGSRAGMLRALALVSAALILAAELLPAGTAPLAAATNSRTSAGIENGAPARSAGFATLSASTACMWSDAPDPNQPVLTDDQVATAVGALVQFSGASSLPNPYGPPIAGCRWTQITNPTVSVFVGEQSFASQPDASAQYQAQLAGVPEGMVETKLKIGGDDSFLAQFNGGPALYILAGDRLLSVAIGRDQSVKDWQNQLTSVGADLVARLAMRPASPGAECSPVNGGPGASAAGQLAGDTTIDDWLGLPDQVLSDARSAAGFFDALESSDVQRMLVGNLLTFNEHHQPIHPEFVQALKASLDACLLSEHFAATLVSAPDAEVTLNDVYGYLSGDPKAAVGLFEPMNANEILAGADSSPGVRNAANDAVDDEYGKLAGIALAQDVGALLDRGNDFSLLVAIALDCESARSYLDGAIHTANELPGSKNLTDFGATPLEEAVASYIQTSAPSPPPATVSFDNSWIDSQLPGTANAGTLTAPNDIYDNPQNPTAGLYYFGNWASDAATLTFLAAVPVAVQNAVDVMHFQDAVVDMIKSACLAFSPFPASGPVCTAFDFVTSTADFARDHDWWDYAPVVQDLIIDSLPERLAPIGVAISIATFSLAPTPEAIKLGKQAAGQFLCQQEHSLETNLLDHSRILYFSNGKTGSDLGPPLSAYLYQTAHGKVIDRTQGLVTFAYSDGSDTGSSVFPLLNDVQEFWRALVDHQIPPTDYESCDLGGADPTLDSYQKTYSGDGYAPQTQVTLTGHSLPVRLAVTRTDSAGHFSVRVDPNVLGVGSHEITATGRTPGGSTRVIGWHIRVSPHAPARDRVTRNLWWIVSLAAVLLAAVAAVLYRRRRPGPSRYAIQHGGPTQDGLAVAGEGTDP